MQGFRVELDGVASVMEAHPGVTRAVALVVGADLWGFFSPSSVSTAELKAFVADRLPYYSVPWNYVTLDEFPMTKCVLFRSFSVCLADVYA